MRLGARSERSCTKCAYYGEEHEGEYGGTLVGVYCHKPGQERFGNLKTFPFKNKRHCFVIDFWHSEFTDEIDGSEKSLDEAFRRYNLKYHD